MKLIDKDALVAEIERRKEEEVNYDENGGYASWADHNHFSTLDSIQDFLNTLEVKEVIAEQECTCNEALNRIIGGSWNLLCPVNKLGLKNGDKVKVIIKAQKGE